jgi:hypothetical protein
VNDTLNVKENDEHAPDFRLQLSRLFSVSFNLDMSFKNPSTAQTFLPERLSNHCPGLRTSFSEICKQFYAIPLSDPSGSMMTTSIKRT